MMNVADLKNPDTGETYREGNNALKHTFPIGSLVEIESGARLFVVSHSRDCDGTPLYSLCYDKDDTVHENSIYKNRGWTGGYSEDGMVLIDRDCR